MQHKNQAYSRIHVPGPSLGALLVDSAAAYPERSALVVDDRAYTYGAFVGLAAQLGALLADAPVSEPALGAVFASHDFVSYLGVAGTLLSGAGYVPLNERFPDARNATMLEASGARSLVIGARFAERLPALLAPLSRTLTVVIPDMDDASALAARHAPHRVIGADELRSVVAEPQRPAVDANAIAYLMFTSGSTGTPRGVMVTHANALHHLRCMWERYSVTPDDRFSQAFDLTFDLSVFDMFVAFGRGAALYSIPAAEALAPAKFIQRSGLTMWFSVPSAAIVLKRMRMLAPGAFPSLRFSLFCGERLPESIATAWQAAAPNSIVENLYGPTEATIACTLYRWDPERSPAECVSGVVPIGEPYPGMAAAIVDDELRLVARGEKGELAMRGPQITAGYWRDPARTAERFVPMPWDAGPENRWYRTGDIAYVAPNGILIFCGRADDQIKLRGFRVELAEIEAALRKAAQTELVAVIPQSDGSETTTRVIGFVAGADAAQVPHILMQIGKLVPDYMVPSEILTVPEMPLNPNGKVDKHQLNRIAQEKLNAHR